MILSISVGHEMEKKKKKPHSIMSFSVCLTEQVCCISEQHITFNVEGQFCPQQHRVLSLIKPHSAFNARESGSIQERPCWLF